MGNKIPMTVLRSHYARMAASYRASAAAAKDANRPRVAALEIAMAEHFETRIAEMDAKHD